MKLKQKHLWIFLTIVIMVVFFGVLYDVGGGEDEPSTTPPAGIQHDTTTNTLYGQIVYENAGPTDEEFKELLIVYLNDNGVTELVIDNITITSRNMINTNEEINFQINCTDCEIIEGYQVNLSTFEDCMLVSNSLHSSHHNIISCSVSSDSNIGGHWRGPRSISGYTINGPQNLKKDGFNVPVSPTCGNGWSNVLECRNSSDGSPLQVQVNGQDVEFLDITESQTNKTQFQDGCARLSGGRLISVPSAISPTDCTDLIDPSGNALPGSNSAACTAVPGCIYTSPDQSNGIVESCIDGNDDARPYVLAGCSKDCTTPSSIPTGVAPNSILENNQSLFNFDVTYTCADNYGLSAGIAGTASPYGAEVCGDAGGPYTIPLDQCTHDCINPASDTEMVGYKCSSLPAGGTTATPTPITAATTCEGELNNNNFNISVSCADGYSEDATGTGATATACGTDGGSYSLGGCLKDCTHDPNQIIKKRVNNVDTDIPYGNIFPSTDADLEQARFNWTNNCGPNYGGSIDSTTCAASSSNPTDNYYKIYGCYPTCTAAEECLNFRIEYDDVGPDYNEFKDNLLNFLSSNADLKANFGGDSVALLNESNFSFFRKHISNGMGVIEYQIKCDAASCDIINDTDFQQFNSGGVWDTQSEGILGCMNPAATNYDQAATSDDGTCVMPPPPTLGSWVLQTTTNETCDTTCAAAGGTCEDGAWGANSEAALNTALTAAGTSGEARCNSYAGASYRSMYPAVAPTAPGGCYYNTGDSTCRDTSGYNRLCKCQDLAAGPTSPPTPTPTPPLPDWHFGDSDETCTQTCQAAGSGTCATGDWLINDEDSMTAAMAIAGVDFSSVCTSLAPELDHTGLATGMSTFAMDDGRCYFRPQGQPSLCDDSAASGRRVCKCDMPPLQEWNLGDLGDNCHQTCQKAGNPGCTDGYWGGQGTAAEQAALFTSAEPADVLANNSAGAINCGTVVANGGTYAPFVEVPAEGYGTGTCKYQGGSGLSECAAVLAADTLNQRLCKCDMP